MKTVSTTASIRATPEKIWALLTDAAGYSKWNTTVQKIEGRIASGERITIYPKQTTRSFPTNVTSFDPGKAMTWSGSIPLGLFKGVRDFTLTPRADGTIEFTMHEVFSGLLEPVFSKMMPDMQPVFEEFAKSLKKEAETT
jgi:hypothetical protein